jgi:hypothetical protein
LNLTDSVVRLRASVLVFGLVWVMVLGEMVTLEQELR